MLREQIDKLPVISKEEWLRAKENRDPMPILFEWYQFVGLLANSFASIIYEPFYCRNIPALHYAVLIGHLNRISKLMASNVRLGCDDSYGETITILSRCIFETTINLRYLCRNYSNFLMKMFLADGVKIDIRFKQEIQKNIVNRGGQEAVIEKRMLKSIERTVETTEMSESQILGQKKWPDQKTICNFLSIPDDMYVSLQKMGSHAVHGTWTDLLINHLDQENGVWSPKDLVKPNENYFGTFPLLVLHALIDYSNFLFLPGDVLEEAIDLLEEVTAKVKEAYSLGFGGDFAILNED